MLVTDHTGKTQRRLLDALTQLSGDRFDDALVGSRDDRLRSRSTRHARFGADAVSAYATQALPKLRGHMKALNVRTRA